MIQYIYVVKIHNKKLMPCYSIRNCKKNELTIKQKQVKLRHRLGMRRGLDHLLT